MSSRLNNDGSLSQKTLSGLQSVRADSVVVGSVDVESSILNFDQSIQTIQNSVSSLQTKTQNMTGLTGTTSFSGELHANTFAVDTLSANSITLSNPTDHPELNFRGSTNRYGLIQFQDSEENTKASIYASNTSLALNFDFGNLPEGFRVNSSGVNKFSIDPSGNAVVSGLLTNNYDRIALGNNAGLTGQGLYSISIGTQAGETDQKLNSIAMGFQAGQVSQNAYSTAIGYWAGQDNQGFNTVAVGTLSGTVKQGENAVALGVLAGYQYQKGDSVSVGTFAGSNRQGYGCLDLGFAAGGNDQGDKSIAVGWRCGNEGQGASSVAIGNECGRYYQGNSSVAIGYNCGFTGMEGSSVAMGYYCGANTQGPQSVAVGYRCGETIQGTQSVAVGYSCGANTQGSGAVALGYKCGEEKQSSDAVAVGGQAGQYNQGHGCVAIGVLCGQYNQTANSVAVGHECGRYTQGNECVAVGYFCGANTPGSGSVAIGHECGEFSQQTDCVAIGAFAGQNSQGAGSVCLGNAAGQTSAGKNAILIGKKAGQTSAHDSTVVLNAHLSSALNTDGASRFYVQPVRNATGNGVMSYNTTTKEITYSSNASFTSLTCSGNISLGGLNVVPNYKGNTALTNCWMVGNELVPPSLTYYPNFSPSSNSQNGYTFAASSGTANAYKAWGSVGTVLIYWTSAATYVNGNPSGTAPLITYNGGTQRGEYITCTLPFEMVASQGKWQAELDTTFGEDVGDAWSIYVKRYNNDVWERVATHTNTKLQTNCIRSFTYNQLIRYVCLQCTSITATASTINTSIRNAYVLGYSLPIITQNLYVPQSLQVGHDPVDPPALDTTNSFVVNGNCAFKSGVSFCDFDAWSPVYSLPDSSSKTGYYLFPGGLLLQWGFVGDPGSSNSTWTYPLAFTYVYNVQATKSGVSNYNPAQIVSVSTTAAVIDSAYGGGDKGELWCWAVGKK